MSRSMKKKILVIDNDKDTLDIVTLVLVDKGYDVIDSLSTDIISNILVICPDLILLDNWLDETRGSEVCKELKANLKTAHIPIIMMSTASGLPAIATDCKADGYMEKPFDLSLLEETVNRLLR
jgi:DNA-binding response OmpR family regulator